MTKIILITGATAGFGRATGSSRRAWPICAKARRCGRWRPARRNGPRRRNPAPLAAAAPDLMSRVFIDRPIFAVVLSLATLAAGLISIFALPVSEYPEFAPPTISVRAVYPGANPTVLAQTVGTPLEDAINGVENMLYMSSSSTADGVLNLTVTFDIGTDVTRCRRSSAPRTTDM